MCDKECVVDVNRQSSVILGRLNTRKSLILLTFSKLDN